MAPEPPVLLYAEYLANIGRISVMAELRTKSSSSTTAYISADGLSMNVCHENVATTITLPARTQPAARLPLSQGKIELSWRLPLADEVPRQSAVDLSDSAKAPWSASGIRPGAEICCRSCDCVIVAGCVKIWKDLPSENWAEMMDFWHCHKPDNNHDHDHNSKHEANQDLTAKKGYGAGKRFKSERGCGFVDLTYLQINPEDCTSINVSVHPSIIDRASRRRPSQLSSTSMAWSPIQIPKNDILLRLKSTLASWRMGGLEDRSQALLSFCVC